MISHSALLICFALFVGVVVIGTAIFYRWLTKQVDNSSKECSR